MYTNGPKHGPKYAINVRNKIWTKCNVDQHENHNMEQKHVNNQNMDQYRDKNMERQRNTTPKNPGRTAECVRRFQGFSGAVFSYGALRCGSVRFYRTAPYDFAFNKTALHRTALHRRIIKTKNPHRTAPSA